MGRKSKKVAQCAAYRARPEKQESLRQKANERYHNPKSIANRNKRAAIYMRERKQKMTKIAKSEYNEYHKNLKTNKRLSETITEKMLRLEKKSKRQKKLIKTESITERGCRLEAKIQVNKEKNVFTWEKFDAERNNFELHPCEICHKMLFSKQRATLFKKKIDMRVVITLQNNNNSKEAFEKFEDTIEVCHRCKDAFSGKNPRIPSQAYWNYYDPGDIPPELKILTDVEVRFVSRLIPYLRIIKLKGRFGQYGLKGQAVLFPCDVTEIQEQLLNVLPRNSTNLDLVLVVESLQNIERQREFQVSLPNIENALKWLTKNNECYKDLTIDMENFAPNYKDFVIEAPETIPENKNSAWKSISEAKTSKDDKSFILHGQRHFKDTSFKTQAGKQGLSMAILSLVLNTLNSIKNWDSINIERVLDLGHRLHVDSLECLMDTSNSNDNNELNSIDFTNVKRCFDLNEKSYQFVFNHRSYVSSQFMEESKGFLLKNKLGILSYNNVYIAFFLEEDECFFFDYRKRTNHGYEAKKQNGTAIAMRFKDVDMFLRRLKSQIKYTNKGEFVLTEVLITFEQGSENIVSTFGDKTPSLFTNPLFKSGSIDEDLDNSEMNSNNIVYASWCQSDPRYMYGLQCTAMAFAALSRSILFDPPMSWTTTTLNEILDAGNDLYERTLMHRGIVTLRYLAADEILTRVNMYDLEVEFSENVQEQRTIDQVNEGVTEFFNNNTHGVFTCQGKSFAIMKCHDSYWLFDSHDNGRGKARLERHLTIRNLSNILIRQINMSYLHSGNLLLTTFSISSIDANILEFHDNESDLPSIEGTPRKSNKHKLSTLQRQPEMLKVFKCELAEDPEYDQIDMVDLVSDSSYSKSSLSDQELENQYLNLQVSPLKNINNDNFLQDRLNLLLDNFEECDVTQNINNSMSPTVYYGSYISKPLNDAHIICVAASAVFFDTFIPFINWDMDQINKIQKEGDSVYKQKNITSNTLLDDTEIFNNIKYLDKTVSFEFREPQNLNVSNREFHMLEMCLDKFFSHYPRGLITFNNQYAFGIYKNEEFYCLYDPYSCGFSNNPNREGKACALITSTFKNFLNLMKGRSSETAFSIRYLLHTKTAQSTKHPTSLAPVDPTLFDIPIDIPQTLMRPIDYTVPRPGQVFDINSKENDLESANIPLVQIQRKTKKPINEFYEKKYEELCFPTLFPYGRHGVYDNQQRDPVPTVLEYYQSRIMGVDKRFFQRDYLLHALSQVEKERVKSSISMCGQIRQNGSDVTNLASNLHLVMRTIRGSSAYWNNTYLDLLSIVKVLGPGHLFITLSCNDLNWEFILKACLVAEGQGHVDPSLIKYPERQRLIENHPVIVSRMFNKEVQNIIRVMKNGTAFGSYQVKDYFFRIEYQDRGSPHLHLIIWFENFPVLNSAQGIDAINQICRCDIPKNDPEFAKMVKDYQTHTHTDTCKKYMKDNNKNNCRFGYPRPPCVKTRVLEVDSPEFLRNGHRLVEIQRTKEYQWINNYNTDILRHWKANMDIQFIVNCSIIQYISKYVSKAEPDGLNSIVRDAIKEAQQSTDQMGRKLFRVGMQILNQRQLSCCEAAARLCHLPLRGCSRKVVFINTSRASDRYRLFKINDGTENTYFTNIIDRYIRRPDCLEDLSLAEFACLYQPYYYKKNSNIVVNEDDGDMELASDDENDGIDQPGKQKLKIFVLKKLGPKDEKAYIQERRNPAVFRSRYFSINGNRIEYFYSLLLLHLPFRREEQLMEKLKTEGTSSQIAHYADNDTEEAFVDKKHLLRPLRGDCTFDEYLQNAEEINRAIMQIQALKDDDGNAMKDNDSADHIRATQEEEIVDIDDRNPDPKTVYDPQKLNPDQDKVYRYVQKVVKADLENKNPKQMMMFITGSAGTGKSVLISNIVQLINNAYIDTVYQNKKVVEVAAPTGVAAMLLPNAKTLHSLLALGIEHDNVSKYVPLTGKFLEEKRRMWQHVKYLIIDEISMVSYQMTRNISMRLQELKLSNAPFGGIHLLTFGDLMQLRPVRGSPIYQQPEFYKAETHFWKHFDFFELKQNMRQKDDLEFSEILNALRVGELHPEQIEKIMSRIESEVLKREGEFSDENSTLIAPTTKIVDEHNARVLNKLTKVSKTNPNPPKLYTIDAKDDLITKNKGGQYIDMNKIVPEDIKKCGGVPKSIQLAIGARVMLRRNISVTKRLVNGSLGKVVSFTWPSFRKDQIYDGERPESVSVDFDGVGIVQIEPMSCTFNANYGFGKIERMQVPLILAYAITAHKLQGVTVERAVIDLGKEIFTAGQAYVMLSRIRNLSKVLILRSFCRKKLLHGCADSDALQEMLRLRNLDTVDWSTLIFEKQVTDPGKRLK